MEGKMELLKVTMTIPRYSPKEKLIGVEYLRDILKKVLEDDFSLKTSIIKIEEINV